MWNIWWKHLLDFRKLRVFLYTNWLTEVSRNWTCGTYLSWIEFGTFWKLKFRQQDPESTIYCKIFITRIFYIKVPWRVTMWDFKVVLRLNNFKHIPQWNRGGTPHSNLQWRLMSLNLLYTWPHFGHWFRVWSKIKTISE